MQIDYLLVGQGLAGSILADHLLKAGFRVQIVSNTNLSNSSKVAGGLYNPVTGRKLVKTWNCDNLFKYLTPYYKSISEQLGEQIIYERPIYRPFLSVEAQNEWMGSSSDGSFDDYVIETYTSSTYGDLLHDDFGGVLLKQCGYVDTALLVDSFAVKFRGLEVLTEESFDFSSLDVKEDAIQYKKWSAKEIVFCEGPQAINNPFFSWLPFKPVKGELLHIQSEHKPKVIYNRGVFLLKKGEICRVGATYDNHNLTIEPTEKAKKELSKKLGDLIKYDYEIVDQKVGIRPATKDRKPFLGRHPKHKNVLIFNGLGAKGVSLAPYYANQLVEWLKGQGNLDVEVNIERYFSLF